MSNLESYAESEMRLIGLYDGDEMNKAMANHIMAMVKVFADEGHSGFSAPYAIGILKKVLAFEPLTPLTGADDEWAEICEGEFQNKRCPHVLKRNGEAYDIEGRIFRDADGCCYTNHESRVPVIFPYTPSRVYVDRP